MLGGGLADSTRDAFQMDDDGTQDNIDMKD
jgi:hypothetical protein